MLKFKVTMVHNDGRIESYIRFAADICHVEEMETAHFSNFVSLTVEQI